MVVLDDDLKPKAAEQVHKSLMAIAGAFSESDEVALGRFASFFTPVLDFTTDNDRLMTELKRPCFGRRLPARSGIDRAQSGGRRSAHSGRPHDPQQAAADKSTKHLDDALHDAAEVLRARAANGAK